MAHIDYINRFYAWLRTNSLELIKICMMLALAAILLLDQVLPREPFVRGVFDLVRYYGALAAIAVPVLRAILDWVVMEDHPAILRNLGSGIIRGIMFYALVSCAVGEFGDGAYYWVTNNPSDAWLFAVGVACIWAIASLTHTKASSRSAESFYGYGAAPSGAVSKSGLKKASSMPVTLRDLKFTSSHEAGHLLPYAALGGVPKGMKLVLKAEQDESRSLGYVTGIDVPHLLDSKSYVEWLMLVLLAGGVAEARLCGEVCCGSDCDFARWTNLAKKYLGNHFDGVFYPEPASALEQESNNEKIAELQLKQRALLSAFFDLNAEVLSSLAEQARQKMTLEGSDVAQYLEKVKFPEGFPFPFGKVEVFTGEWPFDE